MAVSIETRFQVNPAQVSRFMQSMEQAYHLQTGMGAQVRVWREAFAGETSGVVVYQVTLDNLYALAEFNEKLKQSSDWHALANRTFVAGAFAFGTDHGHAVEATGEAVATMLSTRLLDDITPGHHVPK